MENTRQTLLQEADSTPQENLAILKKRARLLAREAQVTDKDQEFLEIVAFRLASETYGIESTFVREVYPLKDFTALPGVPPFVLGIVNVRGQILSVVDLKIFFDLPEKGLGQLNKLIILHSQEIEFGILADDILGAHSIPLDTIQAAPATVSGIGADYVRGVTVERVIVLDAEKILSDEKIIVDQAPF
jgi:purine-binding chemotaxis protein CheW